MSYFNDYTFLTNNILINGKPMPMPSEPVKCKPQNISTGGRLADNIDYEGDLSGCKHTITLKYAILNKEHYDTLFNATQQTYLNGGDFFLNITIPTYTPEGLKSFKVYFMSEHDPACTQTTEREYYRTGDSRYNIGGALYDELHENVEFSFVEK